MIHGVSMEGTVIFHQKKCRDRQYLQIMKNRSQDGGPRQPDSYIGRPDELEASGQPVRRLTTADARYSES